MVYCRAAIYSFKIFIEIFVAFSPQLQSTMYVITVRRFCLLQLTVNSQAIPIYQLYQVQDFCQTRYYSSFEQ